MGGSFFGYHILRFEEIIGTLRLSGLGWALGLWLRKRIRPLGMRCSGLKSTAAAQRMPGGSSCEAALLEMEECHSEAGTVTSDLLIQHDGHRR